MDDLKDEMDKFFVFGRGSNTYKGAAVEIARGSIEKKREGPRRNLC